jgi:hypothetical protein
LTVHGAVVMVRALGIWDRGTEFRGEMGRAAVTQDFEVRSGGRRVAVQEATTAHEALHDYLRGLGCTDAEVVRLGADAAAWRGAVYRVQPAQSDLRVA